MYGFLKFNHENRSDGAKKGHKDKICSTEFSGGWFKICSGRERGRKRVSETVRRHLLLAVMGDSPGVMGSYSCGTTRWLYPHGGHVVDYRIIWQEDDIQWIHARSGVHSTPRFLSPTLRRLSAPINHDGGGVGMEKGWGAVGLMHAIWGRGLGRGVWPIWNQ